MLSIVDDNSLACSVSARSDMLRRSSQTATGSPARWSSTRMMVMESLLAKNPLIRSLKPICQPCTDSPKRDWQVGDVRGIEEFTISQPIAAHIFAFKYL